MSVGVNELTGRSMYPTAPGRTVGQTANAVGAPPATMSAEQAAAGGAGASTSPVVNDAVAKAMQGRPVIWLLMMIGLLVGLMLIARHTSEAGQFANIRMSFYNILVIGLAAVLGINIFKTVFTIFPVKGLSAIFMNA